MALLPLSFRKHALDAVAERKLEFEWIERTVRSPEWRKPDERHPGIERRFRSIPEFGGRILRVACLETRHEIGILTAFFDRDARKPDDADR